jgi:hypothetical protein
MRFADEPAQRLPSRQITGNVGGDARPSSSVEKGEFDRALDELYRGGENAQTDDESVASLTP